ncbi:unnamed protein product [Boreogadus saida]
MNSSRPDAKVHVRLLPSGGQTFSAALLLISNYTPLLHENDIGRRYNQWPNKTIHQSHRGNNRGISGGHRSCQGHRGSASSRPRGHHGRGSTSRRGDPAAATARATPTAASASAVAAGEPCQR